MTVETLLAFTLAMVVLSLTPGPCSLTVIARAGRLFRSERALRRLNRITGGLLVGAGAAVATR